MIAPDCSGQNFYETDRSFQPSLKLHMDPTALAHFTLWLTRLGEVAGGELDRLARLTDRNPPTLQVRDRFGRDADQIVYHPAYHEMERIGFEDFHMHTLCHKPNALGWNGTARFLFIYSEEPT